MLSRRGRQSDADNDNAIDKNDSKSDTVQPYIRMQQSMMAEMDRRRHDWEHEMERLQQDFFKVKLAKPQPTHVTANNNNNSNHLALPGHVDHDVAVQQQQQHLLPQEPEYIRDGDDVICRWQFDVSGYEPEEINVQVDDRKLIVSAQHSDVKDENNSTTKQLNKQFDIPHDVYEQELTSYMTRDKTLVVQAPTMRRDAPTSRGSAVKSTPQMSHDTRTVNGIDDEELDYRFRPIELPPEQPSSTDDVTEAARRRHIVKTDDGEDMLKIVVDLGRSDYKADDVTIQLCPNKIIVRVQHDESFAGKNSIHREFSRDLDVPETVYGPTMRAMLATDGKLWIGASLTTNKNHRTVTSCILEFMPRFAERCRVTQLYALTDSSHASSNRSAP